MKLVIVLCLVALACAQSDKEAQILKQEFQINEDGSYAAAHETSNGIKSEEEGTSFPGNEPETGNYVRKGSYSYEWEGITYTVNWQADENGFVADGDHIPSPTLYPLSG